MEATKAALIVIDMQRGFLDESSPLCIRGARATVPACARVLAHARKTGIPVFYVSRAYRPDGSDVENTRLAPWLSGGKPMTPGSTGPHSAEIPAEMAPQPGDYQLYKPRFSAFFQTELDLMLRRLRIDTVLLTGTTTPNCIRTSCYDAISLDYNVAILTDCCSSNTEEIQQSNLRDMKNIGACLLTSDAFIRQGLPDADPAGQAAEEVRTLRSGSRKD